MPGVNATAHLQPVSKLSTESPGTGDCNLGLPELLSRRVVQSCLSENLPAEVEIAKLNRMLVFASQ